MVFFCLTLVTSSAVAKKPVKPPPEPEPGDGAACVDTELFPAFVYELTGELFLSNAEGDCSISIYRSAGVIQGYPSDISYRFFGDMDTGDGIGKIVWREKSLIDSTRMIVLLLEFEIEDREITTSLPMTPRVVLEEPLWGEDYGGNILGPDLSPSGDRIIVSARTPDEVTSYIWEFEIPESDPVEPWSWNTLFTTDGIGRINRPLYGLSNERERIYFSQNFKLLYIQRNPDSLVWSQNPVLIAEGEGYSDAIGLWNYGEGLREVLAYQHSQMITILDVDACTGSIPPDSGFRCTVVDGIEGFNGITFSTFAEGPLPALLYLYNVDKRFYGYSIRECNLEQALLEGGESCYRTVHEAVRSKTRIIIGVDSAD